MSAFTQTFAPISIADIPAMAADRKASGWRFVQVLAVNTENGIDLVYSFMKDGALENFKVEGVTKDDVVPSITGEFLAAFVFENEAHDLFGVNIKDIAIDFGGNFYALSQKEPMTVISPAQLAAREKAKKLAAAKAAKEAKAAAGESAAEASEASKAADMEAKLAAMDPEKAAKVRAAMEAKAKKEAAAKQAEKDAAMEAKLAAMDPEKAAKVRAAMEAKARKAAAAAQTADDAKGGE